MRNRAPSSDAPTRWPPPATAAGTRARPAPARRAPAPRSALRPSAVSRRRPMELRRDRQMIGGDARDARHLGAAAIEAQSTLAQDAVEPQQRIARRKARRRWRIDKAIQQRRGAVWLAPPFVSIAE